MTGREDRQGWPTAVAALLAEIGRAARAGNAQAARFAALLAVAAGAVALILYAYAISSR
jgi:hypothetical protein